MGSVGQMGLIIEYDVLPVLRPNSVRVSTHERNRSRLDLGGGSAVVIDPTALIDGRGHT